MHSVNVEQLSGLNLETIPLWSGTYAWHAYHRKYLHNQKKWQQKFHLVEDSFLVWNSRCATNYKNASKLLNSFGFPCKVRKTEF